MILVTGGSGFIGGHLLDALNERRRPVRALIRRPVQLPKGVQPFSAELSAGFNLDSALDGVSAVIHLAGVTKALKPAGFYEGNVKASDNLARAAARAGARFIHVSSLAAFGPSPDKRPLNEDDAPQPFTHYGKSKLEAEKAVRAALPQAVIIRPPVVYGPRETGVFQIFQGVARGLVLRVSGEHWFSMIYVHDLVAGLLALLDRPEVKARAYFFSHPDTVAWAELDTTAARIMNRRPRVITVPHWAANAVGSCADLWSAITRTPGIISREKVAEASCAAWVCDPSRIRAELGMEAHTSLTDGLTATLAWYKEVGWIRY